MVSALMLSRGQNYNNQYLLNLLLTPDSWLYEKLRADMLVNQPHTMKVSITHDQDTPLFHESMSGEHQYEFPAAMGKEIEDL